MPVQLGSFRPWPKQDAGLAIADIVKAYETGLAGAYTSPEARERFYDSITQSGGRIDGESVASSSGFVGSAVGKLSIPYVFAIEAMGGNPWPGAPQARGDCTVHGAKNSAVVTVGSEIIFGLPDEETGKREVRPPNLQTAGVLQGALAPEPMWWVRIEEQGGGDGWSCDAAADAMIRDIGLWARANYPEFGFDLTKYSYANTVLFKRSVPADVRRFGMQRRIRTATVCRSWEAAADFLANCYGLNSCGGQSWSNVRDENGFSKTTSGGWAHSEAYLGVDYRPWVKKKYGFSALFLMQNSWGQWNKGPRDIYDSAQFVPPEKKELWINLGIVNAATGNIMIPEGSRWVSSDTVARRHVIAKASALGWPARDLSDYGFSLAG